MKPYLMILSTSPEKDEIRHFLNARDEVDDWIVVRPNVILLRANIDMARFVDTLNAFLKRNQPDGSRTGMLVGLNDFRSDTKGTEGTLKGLMPKAVWDTYAKWSGYEITWDQDPVRVIRVTPALAE
jgi:hypothetical protein